MREFAWLSITLSPAGKQIQAPDLISASDIFSALESSTIKPCCRTSHNSQSFGKRKVLSKQMLLSLSLSLRSMALQFAIHQKFFIKKMSSEANWKHGSFLYCLLICNMILNGMRGVCYFFFSPDCPELKRGTKYGLIYRTPAFESNKPDFEFLFYHLSALWLWASYLMSVTALISSSIKWEFKTFLTLLWLLN